jgi:hypothetical protein
MPTLWLVVGSLAVPAEAKTNSQIDCQRPPQMRGQRRPNFSKINTGIYSLKRRRLTHPLHYIQPTEGAPKVNPSQDDLRNERVRDSNPNENRGAVIEKVICTGQLL